MTSSNGISAVLFLSFIVSFLLTPLARKIGHGARLLDIPNERSSHTGPTPRTGGTAILLGIIAGVSVAGSLVSRPTGAFVFGAVLLAGLSIYDDVRPLPRGFRLLAQLIIAIVVLLVSASPFTTVELPFLGPTDTGALAIPLAVFWIVAVTNAYNFMDGINGIASIEAVICSAALGLLLASGGDLPGTILAASIAGAAAGFLPWNLSGSIFMGDVGSAGLGFLLSVLVVRANTVVPTVAALLPLTPFLFDAGVTLVARALRKERFFSTPHRSHFYQRLVASGLSHITVSLIYGVLGVLSSVLALVYNHLNDMQRLLGVLLLLLLHTCMAIGALFLESKRQIAPV